MSSAPVPQTPPAPAKETPTRAAERVVVFRHSNLFYWWPIWALGYLFALITYFQDGHLAVVPPGTEAAEKRKVQVDDAGTMEVRDVLILKKDRKLALEANEEGDPVPVQPHIFISRSRTLGSIFTVILLIVITITSVTIRGLWTVFVFVTLIMLTFILAAAGWWDIIFQKLGQLSIHINMGGYLLISTVLFVMWFVNFALFDRQTYMIFTPGQVRVRTEIGGEETVYDTTGMSVMKQRADMFRHWILGFGSGDLIIKPTGVLNPIEFPNVMRVGTVVAKVERMVKEKVIVGAPTEKRAQEH
jgi:hypothetical protein